MKRYPVECLWKLQRGDVIHFGQYADRWVVGRDAKLSPGFSSKLVVDGITYTQSDPITTESAEVYARCASESRRVNEDRASDTELVQAFVQAFGADTNARTFAKAVNFGAHRASTKRDDALVVTPGKYRTKNGYLVSVCMGRHARLIVEAPLVGPARVVNGFTVQADGAIYGARSFDLVERVNEAPKVPASYTFTTREKLDWRRIARENPNATLLRVEMISAKSKDGTRTAVLIGTTTELRRVGEFADAPNNDRFVSMRMARDGETVVMPQSSLRTYVGGPTYADAEVFAREGMRVTVTDVSTKGGGA